MFGADRSETEKVLLQLEEMFFMVNGEQFSFVKKDGHLCLLGSGATSNVYEMYGVTVPDRHYALKVIGFGEKDHDHSFVRRAVQAQHMLSEQSVNIVRVLALWVIKLSFDDEGKIVRIVKETESDFDIFNGYLFEMILMEKLENIISKDRYGNVNLLRKDLKDEAGVIKFAFDLGEALSIVHENSYLHRDIKLENVFWDEKNGKYKLGDFGIVRATDNGSAETVVFTDGYGAPEIEKRLQDSYDITADIYSYGITLYLLLNDLTFPASDSYRPSVVQYERDFVLPSPKNASPKMSAVIRKMCNYRPRDRYRSVKEVLSALCAPEELSETRDENSELSDAETQSYINNPGTETFQDTAYDSSVKEAEKSDGSDLTYEEKKLLERETKAEYNFGIVIRMILSTILFFGFFMSMSNNADQVGSLLIWTLPAIMLTESFLQRIGTFHVEFGALSCAVYIWSMIHHGCDALQITLICVTLLGVPAITAGCAVGAGLWIAHVLFGSFEWLAFLKEDDIGFIFLIGLAAVFTSSFLLRACCNRNLSRGENVWLMILNFSPYVLFIAGLILWLLGLFDVVRIPAVDRIHPVKTGIAMAVIKGFFMWRLGLLNNNNENGTGEDQDNDSLDE